MLENLKFSNFLIFQNFQNRNFEKSKILKIYDFQIFKIDFLHDKKVFFCQDFFVIKVWMAILDSACLHGTMSTRHHYIFIKKSLILNPPGSFWFLLVPSGSFWFLLVPSGSFWFLLVPSLGNLGIGETNQSCAQSLISRISILCAENITNRCLGMVGYRNGVRWKQLCSALRSLSDRVVSTTLGSALLFTIFQFR